jgi:ribosomal protein S18 acetylase RimI-like enzyme
MPAIIERASAAALRRESAQLCSLVVETVDLGASIGFLAPVSESEVQGFWDGVCRAVDSGDRMVLVARQEVGLVGCVHLVVDTPANGRHRCEIAKLMVRNSLRGQGIASALMLQAEREAKLAGRSLITLDTQTGSAAERLYIKLGYQLAGNIPQYALSSSGSLDPTSLFFKLLSTPEN